MEKLKRFLIVLFFFLVPGGVVAFALITAYKFIFMEGNSDE